jgi:hypothetical protein
MLVAYPWARRGRRVEEDRPGRPGGRGQVVQQHRALAGGIRQAAVGGEGAKTNGQSASGDLVVAGTAR